MTAFCDHTAGGECCNLGGIACPQHFAQVASTMMTSAADGPHKLCVAAIRDLADHRWIVPAAMTMCALIEHFGRSDGETIEQAMSRVETDTSGMNPAVRADKEPWVFRLGVLARSAIAGDGDQIAAVLSGLSGEDRDPRMTPQRTMSLFASLAMAAHQSVQHPRRDGSRDAATVATFMTLGSQTLDAQAYRMLVPLALLSESFRRGTSVEEPAKRIITAPPTEILAAVGVVGRALGQLVDPDGPLLFTVDGIGGPPAGHQVTGVLDWADTTLDGTRPLPETCLARAMRAAVLFAVDDVDAVITKIYDADNPLAYARDLVMGGSALLANMTAARYTSVAGM